MRFPRASGMLLHPTSLPGPHGSGDFGANAYHFVDWLVAAGQKLAGRSCRWAASARATRPT